MFAGIGTIIGLGGGIIKDVVNIFTERANKKLDAELELKIFKEKQEILINAEKEKNNILLEVAKEEKQAEEFKSQGLSAQYESLVNIEESKTDQLWLESIKDATSYVKGSTFLVHFSNFIIAFIRPAISIYLLWFLYTIYKTSIATNAQWMEGFIEYILTFTETIISFWFYARSTEKLHLKKK